MVEQWSPPSFPCLVRVQLLHGALSFTSCKHFNHWLLFQIQAAEDTNDFSSWNVKFIATDQFNWKLAKSLYLSRAFDAATIYNCNYIEHHQDSGGLMAVCRLLLWTNSNNNLDCSWLLLSTESGWPSLKVFVPPTCVVAVVCVVVPPCTAITPLLVCILCPVSWQSSAWRRANKS